MDLGISWECGKRTEFSPGPHSPFHVEDVRSANRGALLQASRQAEALSRRALAPPPPRRLRPPIQRGPFLCLLSAGHHISVHVVQLAMRSRNSHLLKDEGVTIHGP